MIFYDFEVFRYDWMVVIADSTQRTIFSIINDRAKLEEFYKQHNFDIWIGYNSRHYDQWILKTILSGLDPKEMNDWIILKHREPYQFSDLLNKIPLNNYDVMPNPPIGMKTLEGFMGSNIKETDVPFDIDRKLTKNELKQTEFYCRHDVEETMKVFLQRKSEFDAQFQIVKLFKLPLKCIGETEAQITARVLECSRHSWNDEFDYFFLPCIRLKKYKRVMGWFVKLRENAKHKDLSDPKKKKKWYKKQNMEIDVAGVPHSFGFGGVHGAIDHPVHMTGLILHVDVGSYYPSMLIAWNLVTRSAAHPEQYKHVYDTRMALKRAGKKREQAPYKKLLNALSGAMKDQYNPAYDPRNNNCMCVNGQLMLLDLIEHLEVVPGFELIQSNTDGLIIRIPDTDEAFNQVDDICYEWESRCSTDKCSILLGLDTISEIFQKDVNNYIWIDADGNVERKGAYVKTLNPIDYDLPIINKALVERMVHKTPVEDTINDCDDLIMFQKIVKLSDKYERVGHEEGVPEVYHIVKHHDGTETPQLKYPELLIKPYKAYRVFASTDIEDGRIVKIKGKKRYRDGSEGPGNPEKFGNTPDHCFIVNDSIEGAKASDFTLDKEWYIKLAHERLKDYGL